ncbi:hypothetical protein [Agrococcus sp. Marseille-P2731]|uniref:hypothetical protein n=1 Tax=Agrococcus sp. Marseille-P2731 TaxID=1841862 RepID=UPI000931668F|nr:hypothetical protein [Agrococcus sp. Marseille-P2731]
MRSIAIGGIAAAVLLGVAGCASAGGPAPTAPGTASSSLADLPTPSPAGEVLAVATVLEQGDGQILCAGGVAESAPPQCEGPELLDWDWDAFDHQETGGVRWAQGVAITGTYDAEASAFTQTGEPMSAAAITLPAAEVPVGDLDATTVESLQRELSELDRPDFLVLVGEQGILALHVLYDDGSIQAALDEVYGAGSVFVTSALLDSASAAGDGSPGMEPPMDTAAPVITGADAQARLAELPSPLPSGTVIAAGLAMDGAEGEVLCLGDVGASAPPICSGVPMIGFDWTALEADDAQGARWVDASVTGTWDGEAFAVTAPPKPFDAWSPRAVEQSTTVLTEEELAGVQADLLALDREDILGHGPSGEHYELRVLYDDGSIQSGLDAIYGTGAVQVFSAMQG